MSTVTLRYRLRRMERRFDRGVSVAFLNPGAPGYEAAQERVAELEREGRRMVVYRGGVFKNRVHG